MNRERAIEFTRQNTGAHMLDSGGAYGRIYDRPPPDVGPVSRIDDGYQGRDPEPYEAYICVTELLQRCCTEYPVFQQLIRQMPRWTEDHYYTWGEAERDLLPALGYVVLSEGDNTYNHESDLDQVLQYTVWGLEDYPNRDWVYADSTTADVNPDLSSLGIPYDEEADDIQLPVLLTVITVHTGCDVRGGYSDPLFCQADFSEYCVPFDTQIEWQVERIQPVVRDDQPVLPGLGLQPSNAPPEYPEDFESSYRMTERYTPISFARDPQYPFYGVFIVVPKGTPEPEEGEEDVRPRYEARFYSRYD